MGLGVQPREGTVNPLPVLPDPACCLRNQPQQLHFFLPGLTQTSDSWEGWEGPSQLLSGLCASPPWATGALSA